MNLLQFKNEAELQYAKRIDEPDTEHKAEFPELNDEEGDVEAVRVEHHQLENGGYGHNWDLELQNSQTEGLHVRGSLQFECLNQTQCITIAATLPVFVLVVWTSEKLWSG